VRFAQIARAYELMPDGFWALLSIIVAFYFGGRMQLKRQDLAIRGGALEVAREVLALQQARRERDAVAPSLEGAAPSLDADGLNSLPSGADPREPRDRSLEAPARACRAGLTAPGCPQRASSAVT
jgi:hypothetical protein